MTRGPDGHARALDERRTAADSLSRRQHDLDQQVRADHVSLRAALGLPGEASPPADYREWLVPSDRAAPGAPGYRELPRAEKRRLSNARSVARRRAGEALRLRENIAMREQLRQPPREHELRMYERLQGLRWQPRPLPADAVRPRGCGEHGRRRLASPAATGRRTRARRAAPRAAAPPPSALPTSRATCDRARAIAPGNHPRAEPLNPSGELPALAPLQARSGPAAGGGTPPAPAGLSWLDLEPALAWQRPWEEQLPGASPPRDSAAPLHASASDDWLVFLETLLPGAILANQEWGDDAPGVD